METECVNKEEFGVLCECCEKRAKPTGWRLAVFYLIYVSVCLFGACLGISYFAGNPVATWWCGVFTAVSAWACLEVKDKIFVI